MMTSKTSVRELTFIACSNVVGIELAVRGDTKRQFRILLVTLKTYRTKKHDFLVFRRL